METSSDEEFLNDDPAEDFPSLRSVSKEDLLSSLDEFELDCKNRSRSNSTTENFQKILEYEQTIHKSSSLSQKIREQMSSPEIGSPDKKVNRYSRMMDFVQQQGRNTQNESPTRITMELETSRDSMDSQDEYFPSEKRLSKTFGWWEDLKSELEGKEEELEFKKEEDFTQQEEKKEPSTTTES